MMITNYILHNSYVKDHQSQYQTCMQSNNSMLKFVKNEEHTQSHMTYNYSQLM